MGLPLINEADFENKRVLLRADFDVVIKDGNILETLRLDIVSDTLNKILEKKPSKIILLGHIGRPEGFSESLSLQPALNYLSSKIQKPIKLLQFFSYDNFFKVLDEFQKSKEQIVALENLRFWKEEEANSEQFAQKLVSLGDIFVNEAFAASHREHTSIVGIPKFVNGYAGLRLEKEIENLNKVLSDPKKPVVAIISGVKEDKLSYLEDFKRYCDKILIGGRLPLYLEDALPDEQILIAKLNQDKEDITLNSIENFESEVNNAGTIILSGPLGKYEQAGQILGTQRIFEAVARSMAFKVAGGGDTIAAINLFNLSDKFDWISIGGGAMLEFLAKGTLPGIDVLLS